MKKSDWAIEIRRVNTGFIIKDNEGEEYPFRFREDLDFNEEDVTANLEVLWFIIEFFNLRGGSRYDRRRVLVIEEAGDKYICKKGEKLKKEEYFIVVKENE